MRNDDFNVRAFKSSSKANTFRDCPLEGIQMFL